MEKLLKGFEKLDRRWVFFAMVLAVLIPLLKPCALPFGVSPAVQGVYDAVEALPPGSKILFSGDYDPGSMAELQPFTVALMEHLFRKDLRVVAMELWPGGVPLIQRELERAGKKYGKAEGVDWINLGFKEGRQVVIQAVCENLIKTYPNDSSGRPTMSHEIMKGIGGVKDFALVIEASSGFPGASEWVQVAQTRYGFPMVAATTAVMDPQVRPYLLSGQLRGLAGGMRGSAEYEKLVGVKGTATAGMDAQSMGHFLIVFLILLGNIAYFMGRSGSKPT